MATGRSYNNYYLASSAADDGLPPSDSFQRQRNGVMIGAEGGVERSSYYNRSLPYEDWYEDDDYAAYKVAASAQPAAAGDCSPRPNYRRPTTFDPDSELYEAEDYQGQKLSRRTYSEQLDRRLVRSRPDTIRRTRLSETQSDKTVGLWTEKQPSDKSLARWSTPVDIIQVNELDQLQDPRRRHALPQVGHSAAGAGDNDPTQSTLTRQQSHHVDNYVTVVDHPRGAQSRARHDRSTQSLHQRRQAAYDTVDDGRDTASEPAAPAESVRYSSARTARYFIDSSREDVSHARSDMTNLRRTRRPRTSTKADQRSEGMMHSQQQQQRANKASRSSEQRDVDVTSRKEATQDSRQYASDVRRRHLASTAQSVTQDRWADTRSTSRRDQRASPVVDEPDNAPRRIVFRRTTSSSSKYKDEVEDVIDHDDDAYSRVEEPRRTGSKSLIQRMEKASNQVTLLRAINKAAMRVNPKDPDAFLSLLSSRAGHAEQLDEEPDLYDQAIQTDLQPLPVVVDNGTPARIKQLQREMVDLKRQAKLTEMITYATLPFAAILMLLFAGKLWAVMHTGVSITK